MAQGSGSAPAAAALGLALLCMLLYSEVAHAAVYTVGGNGGWTIRTDSAWQNGKQFRAGDVLVFKYDSSLHNLVVVSGAGYTGCSTPRGSKFYRSGNDRVTLSKGKNYFICGFAGHCDAGMKLAITAL